ncbi:YeeE/YedE family protein [Vibrio sp.]|nr:YeeE/YedE family protein [Vibrio sp.]
MLSFIFPILSGLLFGLGMTISGMTDTNKVLGFLDVLGQWDPSLLFVMGGALMVFSPVYFLQIKQRKTALDGTKIALPTNQSIDAKLIIGAVLFGLGWGLLGVCPGPAFASAASLSGDVFLFIVVMMMASKGTSLFLAR